MATYRYTLFGDNPMESTGTQWPSHTDIEIDAGSIEEARAMVMAELRTQAPKSDPTEYAVGDPIYALIWDPEGFVDCLDYALTSKDLGLGDVIQALDEAGYDAYAHSGGSVLCVPVTDGPQSDGSKVDGEPDLIEIRAIVARYGMTADWSGDSDTDGDGDTTSDVSIDWAS